MNPHNLNYYFKTCLLIHILPCVLFIDKDFLETPTKPNLKYAVVFFPDVWSNDRDKLEKYYLNVLEGKSLTGINIPGLNLNIKYPMFKHYVIKVTRNIILSRLF